MITIDINRDDKNEKLYFEEEAPLLLKIDNENPLECFIEKAFLRYKSKDIYDGSGTLIAKPSTKKIGFIINSKGNFSKSNWFKNGKWLEEDGFKYCSYDELWKCSECGFISTSKMNFCGGCGADMRE